MLALIAYISVIFLANWAIQTFHLVPVGFGLMAPAGVYFAGLAFTLRDLVQEKMGRNWTIAAIIIGAVLSYAIEPTFALASGVAFLVSEFLDFAVYTPLRKRNWMMAVTLSNLAGLTADSALFLWLAFGDISYLPGQVVGKLWMTMAFVAALWLYRRHREPSKAGR